MPSFHYRACDARGTLAQGRLEAASSDAVRDALWTQGLTPRNSRPEGAGTPSGGNASSSEESLPAGRDRPRVCHARARRDAAR